MEATIETLATKYDLAADLRKELSDMKGYLNKKLKNSIKWMFIFGVSQVGATLAIFYLFVKK